ncbi:STAS domain-containing protein [Streptomyces sp. NPDC047453]|uniref:STAS domain-containing protein n=1 Tax=Streptomyces sp. NPDC047453 TaxID=3154812 RepID=UPI0033CE7CFF
MAAAHLPASPLVVRATDGRRAELALTGDIGAEVLRPLEERLGAPSLSDADEWIVDMSEATHLDLACAYALLRVATRWPATALTIRGARRTVHRTLRHAGLDTAAVMEDLGVAEGSQDSRDSQGSGVAEGR